MSITKVSRLNLPNNEQKDEECDATDDAMKYCCWLQKTPVKFPL